MRTEQEIKDRIGKCLISISGEPDTTKNIELIKEIEILNWILNEPKTNHPNKLKR